MLAFFTFILQLKAFNYIKVSMDRPFILGKM